MRKNGDNNNISVIFLRIITQFLVFHLKSMFNGHFFLKYDWIYFVFSTLCKGNLTFRSRI